jgi:hypothetical protein
LHLRKKQLQKLPAFLLILGNVFSGVPSCRNIPLMAELERWLTEIIPIFGYEFLHTSTLVFIVRMVFERMSEEFKTLYFTDKKIKQFSC